MDTRTACKIARIDRNRFNEAVASGNYPAARPTKPGQARRFSVDDTVMLYVYGALLRQGMKPSAAGEVVHLLALRMWQWESPTRPVRVRYFDGQWEWFRSESEIKDRGVPILYVETWYLENILKEVMHVLSHEPPPTG